MSWLQLNQQYQNTDWMKLPNNTEYFIDTIYYNLRQCLAVVISIVVFFTHLHHCNKTSQVMHTAASAAATSTTTTLRKTLHFYSYCMLGQSRKINFWELLEQKTLQAECLFCHPINVVTWKLRETANTHLYFH